MFAPAWTACVYALIIRIGHLIAWDVLDTYGGEKEDCGFIIAIFELPDAFLEFPAPSLCHFCENAVVDRSYALVFGHTKHVHRAI